jgi:hypothetical protein
MGTNPWSLQTEQPKRIRAYSPDLLLEEMRAIYRRYLAL